MSLWHRKNKKWLHHRVCRRVQCSPWHARTRAYNCLIWLIMSLGTWNIKLIPVSYFCSRSSCQKVQSRKRQKIPVTNNRVWRMCCSFIGLHSSKILTIQQGDSYYFSILSNPCTLHWKNQADKASAPRPFSTNKTSLVLGEVFQLPQCCLLVKCTVDTV